MVKESNMQQAWERRELHIQSVLHYTPFKPVTIFNTLYNADQQEITKDPISKLQIYTILTFCLWGFLWNQSQYKCLKKSVC